MTARAAREAAAVAAHGSSGSDGSDGYGSDGRGSSTQQVAAAKSSQDLMLGGDGGE